MRCKPKPLGVVQTTIIENPGLIVVHNYTRIAGCISIPDWQAAGPNIPINQMEADHWDRLGFNEKHNMSVALFVNAQRQRLTLTGAGLFQCALSMMLLDGTTTFEVESMVERILGNHSENWHDAEDFLDTTVPYIAAQSGKLASAIPGDNSERRAYLSPRHQRLVAPAFWTEMFGPVNR